MVETKSKIAIITGATSGIGRACTNRLLEQGYRLHIFGRNLTKVYTKEIMDAYPIALWECDYTDLTSVNRRLTECLSTVQSLDLILHASGVVTSGYEETADLIEKQFQVNYLVQFFITQKSIDLLTEEGLVCLIGSEEHRKATFELKDLCMKDNYQARSMYQRTKLCQLLYANKLDESFDYETGGGVVVVHPGIVNTGFGGKNITGLKKWFWELYGTLREGKSAGEAADDVLTVIGYDRFSRELYYNQVMSSIPSDLATDQTVINQLYDTSCDMLKHILVK